MSAQQRTVSDVELDMIVAAQVAECMRTLTGTTMVPAAEPVPTTGYEFAPSTTTTRNSIQSPHQGFIASTSRNALRTHTTTPSHPLQPQRSSLVWTDDGGSHVPGARFDQARVRGSMSGSRSVSTNGSMSVSTSASMSRSTSRNTSGCMTWNTPQTNPPLAVGQYWRTPVSGPAARAPQIYTSHPQQYTAGRVPGNGYGSTSENNLTNMRGLGSMPGSGSGSRRVGQSQSQHQTTTMNPNPNQNHSQRQNQPSPSTQISARRPKCFDHGTELATFGNSAMQFACGCIYFPDLATEGWYDEWWDMLAVDGISGV